MLEGQIKLEDPSVTVQHAHAEPLPHARLHDLRHLHATTLLLAGVPVHVVAARLGHADPAVTLRVYSHVLREHALGVGAGGCDPRRCPPV
jgi:integrase